MIISEHWVCYCDECLGIAGPPEIAPCVAPSPNGLLVCGEYDGHAGPHGNWW